MSSPRQRGRVNVNDGFWGGLRACFAPTGFATQPYWPAAGAVVIEATAAASSALLTAGIV